MAGASNPREAEGTEASMAELVKQLSEQTSRLARQEVELAKAELTAKGKRAGIGAGMFGGAAMFGLYAVGALTAAAILGLSNAVAAWLAALIVTAVLAAIAGVLALTGKREVAAGDATRTRADHRKREGGRAMGEEPSTGSAAVTGATDQPTPAEGPREPEAIQHEIEQTREELGDTVAALAQKTDVKAQAKQKLDDTKASVSETKDRVLGKAKDASPESASSAAAQVSQKARENPLPVAALGALAAGFLIGRATRR